MNKQQSYDNLARLVEKFATNLNEYKVKNYNEAQARVDFINPFFELLGWDIDNKKGMPESYRDVIYEDKLRIGGSVKAPDYCFTINGNRKFFVEAKKPIISIKDKIEPAYQLRRYGWSAKMPVSLLTDFEELSLYDCSLKPNPTDGAFVSRLKYLTFKDYINEFNFLWDVFSKEQIDKGSLAQFINANVSKTNRSSVDAEFLKSLDKWRDLLAHDLVRMNDKLDEDQLNYSLQKIIDRIVFLRICEDRGIEFEEQLLKATKSANIYTELKNIFHIADQKYNSGLFDYNKDNITDQLKISNEALNNIINEMYYPICPYEFSVIPVEILGHSYEQYLGKVIKITSKHDITIEEKPEVRKAGGVYYTPQYIVDYIVKNTVGKLVENQTPEQVSKLKICDPACGSGSFLLGAYQFLLNWHLDYYTANPHKSNPLTPDGNLTTQIKKQILLNNIYGVDIDTNAVEVTKLSLMLKALEGETKASINHQLSWFHDRILPTLDDNIKSGNSLIDIDFYESQIDFEPGQEKKIKPFNWESAFPTVFKQGGFDAFIGNPPYVQPIILDKHSQIYLIKKYKANTDLYSMFIEKLFQIIKNKHFFGFIVPSLFIKGVRYDSLRKVINENSTKMEIIEYGDGVFSSVQMPTCILISTIGKNTSSDLFQNNNINLFTKVSTIKLNEISIIRRGLEIGRDKIKKQEKIKCLNGSCIDRYMIKEFLYISESTFFEYNKSRSIFESPKIIVRETGNTFFSTIDSDSLLTNRSLYNVKVTNLNYSPYYILSIINSSLFKFYFKQFIAPNTNIFPKIRIAQLNEIPIVQNPKEEVKSLLIKYSDSIIELNKEFLKATLPEQKEHIQQRINYTDKQIDKLVYELYELTEEEIKIVEGESN